jgi:hypothetical protein
LVLVAQGPREGVHEGLRSRVHVVIRHRDLA